MTDFQKIWTEQCEATREIEAEFGCQQALEYLVGEKFLDFLEAAETNAEFRGELLAFAAEIKTIFEPWQLASYLDTGLESKPFDPDLFVPRDMPLMDKEGSISMPTRSRTCGRTTSAAALGSCS